jgi:hypothetical protein
MTTGGVMKTCGRGHEWNPEVNRQCPVCQSAQRKARREKHREEEIQQGRAWVEKNKERYDLSQIEWNRRHPGHNCYRSMLNRCFSPKNDHFKHYGGRGITVCERWQGKDGYRNFIADMGDRPSVKHTIDRIDNNGNYEPGNVQWAVKVQQMRNFRRNVNVTLAGRTQCLSAWAEELNLTPASFWLRLHKGWSEERLLSPNSQPDQLRKRRLNTASKVESCSTLTANLR